MEKDLMKKKFGLPPMPPIVPGAPPKRNLQRKKDYSPVEWGQYFERQFDINTEDGDTFCAYSCGTEGPVVLFLHGGGFSALSWALLSVQMTGLVKCRCVAVDQRGHGDTTTTDDSNLSAEQLSNDIGKIVSHLYPNESPPIILVGHSMGGAIAVHVAHRKLIPSLVGLVVIDVVEGTAMDALSSMQSFLRNRPKSFKSMDLAIEWAVRSGQIQNLSSAKVSMTGQLMSVLSSRDKPQGTGTFTDAIQEEEEEEEDEVGESSSEGKGQSRINSQLIPSSSNEYHIQEEEEEEEDEVGESSSEGKGQSRINSQLIPSSSNEYHIQEEEEEEEDEVGESSSEGKGQSRINSQLIPSSSNETPEYTWRIDLSKTEPYWRGWFTGLSQMFLSCSPAKMLILAGHDRLDKDLTIGQMQGKFQMNLLPQCGHAVHEDVPDKVADMLAGFMIRHKVAQPITGFERSIPRC